MTEKKPKLPVGPKQVVTREDRWSEAIAVRSLVFIDKVKSELGFKDEGTERFGARLSILDDV